MNRFVVITAGGTGSRMKSETPKQFLVLGRLPILMHSINRFYLFDSQINIILSLPEEYFSYWKNLCKEYQFNIKHRIVSGGKTRFHSVKNALRLIEDEGLVAVHDGVRPLVNTDTIRRTFETAEKCGNAVAACDIVFSIRKIEGENNFGVKRNLYKEIQTPQIFDVSALKDAYNIDYERKFTDDASVFEAAGHRINLVSGNKENIKITSPEDMIIAESLLNRIF